MEAKEDRSVRTSPQSRDQENCWEQTTGKEGRKEEGEGKREGETDTELERQSKAGKERGRQRWREGEKREKLGWGGDR